MGIKYNNMPKTMRIHFLDLNGEPRETTLTMDFTLFNHNDILDLIPLQKKVSEGGTIKPVNIIDL